MGARSHEQDLGDILLATHLIEEPALAQARRECQRTSRPLWRLLTRDGLVSEDALFRALRQEVRVPVLAADQLKSVDVPHELKAALPPDVAQHLGILPLERSTDGHRAALAMVDPTADITPLWPALTKLGVTEVRRFLVHLGTLRLGLEFFYGQPWQPERDDLGEEPTVGQGGMTPPRSAIAQPIPAGRPAAVVVDPRLNEELMDAPTDPNARAVTTPPREGAIHTAPSLGLAREAAITGEVPRLIAPGHDAAKRAAVAAAGRSDAGLAAYRVRRESSLPEISASDIEMVDVDEVLPEPDREPGSLLPASEPVQDALSSACEALLATLSGELRLTRPESLAKLAQSIAERLGFAPRAVRELMLVSRLYGMLRLHLLRVGPLPRTRSDLVGFDVEHPLMAALRELQTVMVDFIRLPTEPDLAPLGARIVEAATTALALLDEGLTGEALVAELRTRSGDNEVTAALVQTLESDLQALGIEVGRTETAEAAALREGRPLPPKAAPPQVLVLTPLGPVMPDVAWKTVAVPGLRDDGLTLVSDS